MRVSLWLMVAACCCAPPPAAASGIALSDAHLAAVNRPRRIVVQYDAADHRHLAGQFSKFIDYLFGFADEQGSQIDSIYWDIGLGDWAVYPSKVLPPHPDPAIRAMREAGIDWVRELVEAARRRKLEVFWNHRISEVEIRPEGGSDYQTRHPLKRQHPEWILKSWWWPGMWNLAEPGVREYKLGILRELASLYELDGIQIDFARHIPCLPPGRQWEHRGQLTEFMRAVRMALLDVEKKRGRPFLLAAKVPENERGCHIDGFDVETWAREGLVDIFTVGSRTMEVDLEFFRRITAGRNIKIQPSLDDHHSTDGYRHPPIEFLRGVYANWWRQGADAVATFNWTVATPEAAARMNAHRLRGGYDPAGVPSHRQAYHEVGSPERLKGKDKMFAVERRGGYKWAEGYFNRNDTAPLPARLYNDGRETALSVRVSDDVAGSAASVASCSLAVVLSGAKPGDAIGARINGVETGGARWQQEWTDPQIRGASLSRVVFALDPKKVGAGRNAFGIRVLDRVPYRSGEDISIEKLEVHVRYRK